MKYEMTISIDPKLSIIIPVRMKAHRMLPMLQAFNQQKQQKKFELLFVDDNSIDDTVSVIEAHLIPDVRYQVISNRRQIGINRRQPIENSEK